MKRLRSVVEAAEVLGISHYTVRKWIRDGKLRAVRLGRRVLLEEAELERFVAEGKRGDEAEHRGVDDNSHLHRVMEAAPSGESHVG